MKLSEKLKEYQKYLEFTSGIDSDVEEMIIDAEAIEKQLKQTDCNCSAEETTGWTTFRLCNICGKIQKK